MNGFFELWNIPCDSAPSAEITTERTALHSMNIAPLCVYFNIGMGGLRSLK